MKGVWDRVWLNHLRLSRRRFTDSLEALFVRPLELVSGSGIRLLIDCGQAAQRAWWTGRGEWLPPWFQLAHPQSV